MPIPPDNHVHSEWSWDATDGSMERTCARAVELGLPAIAFTEHVDHTRWVIAPDELEPDLRALVRPDGTFSPPPMDVNGYLLSLQDCRDKFPELRIISGVELGEPHLHDRDATALLSSGDFERVLGSLHVLPSGQRFVDVPLMYDEQPVAEVLRDYLAEITNLVERSDLFTVLAHIDYPIRYLPAGPASFDPMEFEAEFRTALRALARTDRALEVNTQLPLHPRIVRWWYEVGGTAVSFGSDAHEPDRLAYGFVDAAAMVEACGFRPGRHPHDFWRR